MPPIAKVASLLPVIADEADLAAQCIAARGQAEDLLRLLRQHAGDIGLVMGLNAQYGSMVRISLSVHGRLMRLQALRRKRAATGTTVSEDSWALHVVEQSMLAVVDPDAGPPKAAPPNMAPPKPATIEAPAAFADQPPTENVSETATNSQDAGFETWLREQPWNAGSGTALRNVVHEAIAKSRSGDWNALADDPESAARTPLRLNSKRGKRKKA